MRDQVCLPSRVRRGIGSAEGFRAALAVADVEGWDGAAGQQLLDYVRSEVVVPAVDARRLRGPARDDAIAAGWAAGWLASTSRSVRSAASPWGAIRAAVERAIGGSYVADRCASSARTGWRRIGDGCSAPVVVAMEATSLERAAERRDSLAAVAPSDRLGHRLEWIRAALVAAGWEPVVAEDALTWVAFNYSGSAGGVRSVRHRSVAHAAAGDGGEVVEADAVAATPGRYADLRCAGCGAPVAVQVRRRPAAGEAEASVAAFRLAPGATHMPGCAQDVAGAARGWRVAAEALRLPGWRLRRLAVLVAGGRDHVGLLELVVTGGRDVLNTPTARRAIATTVRRWAPCPSAVLGSQCPPSRSVACAA
jgi:hypothetical protein